MHVTSMRPRQEKLGTGSVPHPLPVSLLGALTPVFTTVICLVFLCLCIRLFFPSKRPLLLYSFYNGHYSSVTLSLFLSSLSLSKLFTTHQYALDKTFSRRGNEVRINQGPFKACLCYTDDGAVTFYSQDQAAWVVFQFSFVSACFFLKQMCIVRSCLLIPKSISQKFR